MDKIGDYIPLIIIALSFIYSFARKAGKKTAEDASKTMLPNGIPDKNVSKPQVRPKLNPQPQVIVSNPSPKKEKKPFTPQKQILPIEETTDNNGILLDFNNVDELKKGIIYAEIFNRKY